MAKEELSAVMKAKDILTFETRVLKEEYVDQEGKKTTHVTRRFQVDLDVKRLLIVALTLIMLLSYQIVTPIIPRIVEALLGMSIILKVIFFKYIILH